MLKRSILILSALFLMVGVTNSGKIAVSSATTIVTDGAAIISLGERLFNDNRFSTSKGDLPASCSNCHLYDQDPQGLRSFTDFFNKSWVSSRTEDPRRLGLRNSPTLLDVDILPRLHHDGEFGSLEELVKGTISGRTMGWLPGEEEQAFDQAKSILINDRGNYQHAEGTYRELFKTAFSVDISKAGRDELINLLSKAVADYIRTFKSKLDSPYDKFITANGLSTGTAQSESARDFSTVLLSKISSLESKGGLKWVKGFDSSELKGLKVFYSTGNCVTCHAPPYFSDFSFHNIGVAQREYDDIHGDGEFVFLDIPAADKAKRPSLQLRETPSKHNAGLADLGYWNFVDLKKSPLRRSGENDDQFLNRMVGTFKTPSLRNLDYSFPYLHNGSLNTLEQVMDELRVLGEMARNGKVRQADDELLKIRITEADIPSLVAFLKSLNEDLSRGFSYIKR